MFWYLAVFWTIVFGGGLVGEATKIIQHSPINIFVYLVVLPVLYVLSGIHAIKEWERRPVLLFGKYSQTAGPGLVWIEPAFHTIMDEVSVQDIVKQLEVPNVPTHDNVRLTLKLALTTKIDPANVKQLIVQVQNPNQATTQRAIATVTEVVGKNQLDYILGERVEFSTTVKDALAAKVTTWGIQVKAVEINDFKIADPEIEKAIAMKAKALKEAEAELKRAEMQVKIAEQLKIAAETYDDKTWRLKGLETLVELCRSAQNNTILLSTDLLQGLANVMPEELASKIRQAAVKVG